jgi:spore coat protein U-like protein
MPIGWGRIARLLALLTALLAGAAIDAAQHPAHAAGVLACSVSMTNVAFGSIDVLPGAAFSTNAQLKITCSGLSILPTEVDVCVAFPAPWKMTGPSGSALNYQLLGPPPATNPWSNTAVIPVPVTGSFFSFGGSVTINVGATLLANQQGAVPGAYTQTVSGITATYDAISVGVSSCTGGLILPALTTTFAYTATATVLKSCNVSATNLNFGVFGNLRAAIPGQSGLSVQCSNGAGYSIGLNGGNAGAADPTQRKMTSGANAITYGLYQDSASTLPWGSNVGANVVNGTGTSVLQPYSVYGLVPIQATPPPGTYTDNIVVSVTY